VVVVVAAANFYPVTEPRAVEVQAVTELALGRLAAVEARKHP
jgi:hypothetical protein